MVWNIHQIQVQTSPFLQDLPRDGWSKNSFRYFNNTWWLIHKTTHEARLRKIYNLFLIQQNTAVKFYTSVLHPFKLIPRVSQWHVLPTSAVQARLQSLFKTLMSEKCFTVFIRIIPRKWLNSASSCRSILPSNMSQSKPSPWPHRVSLHVWTSLKTSHR